MFAKATTKFVAEIDPSGCLLPVSRLNESDNLALLSLVIKRKRFWIWQQPKYLTSDFSLNDVLVGDEDIDPGVIETDFLKYSSTLGSNTSGGAEADVGPGNINVVGKGSSTLASSFGNLTKQEVHLQRLLDGTKHRILDLQHSLVQQTRERRWEVLGVVKERIVTTQPCTISEEVHEAASCGAFLGFIPKKIRVSVKNGSHQCDSNVAIEIPAKTALAYSLLELRVRRTGHFGLCLLPDNSGGFETDGGVKSVAVLYSTPPETPNKQLQEELDSLQALCKVLSDLPSSTRYCLFQQFSVLLNDREAIGALDLALEDVCCGKKPDLSRLDDVPSRRAAVENMLELLQGGGGTGDDAQAYSTSSGQHLESSPITAAHILSSALEEMSDSVLSMLESCCCSPIIQALQLIIQHVVENRRCSLTDSRLAVLRNEDTYCRVVELFSSSNMVLSKEEDLMSGQLSSPQGHEPLILCIAICVLASLAPPV